MRRELSFGAIILLSLCICLMLLPVFGYVPDASDNDNILAATNSNANADTRASHGVITISGNGGFSIGSNGVTGGAGTVGSPWMIDNWQIAAAGGVTCISISGTTAYFNIKNCDLSGATGGGSNMGGGIYFYNVQNGKVESCIIHSNNIGINVANSQANNITTNTVHNNTINGIWFSTSSSNKIYNNGVNDNGVGYYQDNSNYNVIEKNSIYSNTDSGISIYNKNRLNVINWNSVKYNGLDGISLAFFCENNTLKNNNASQNVANGISIAYTSHNSTVWSNRFYKNENNGFSTRECTGMSIRYNTFDYNNRSGALMTFGGNNTLNTNYVYDNIQAGVKLFNSNYTTMTNNVFLNNGLSLWGDSIISWNTHSIDTTNKVNGKTLRYVKNTAGGTAAADTGQIILANCTGYSVSSMDLRHASIGVQLGFSKYCTATQNNVSENGDCGVLISGSQYNNVTYNKALNCGYQGINIYKSEYNFVDHNVACYTDTGILVRFANKNRISNNTVNDNDLGINLWNAQKNDVYNNYVLRASNSSIAYDNGYNNTVRNNTCAYAGYKGMWLWDSDKNTIKYNSIYLNGENGVFMWDSGFNYLMGNIVHNNPHDGVLAEYSSSDNKFYYNQFYSNGLSGLHLRMNCPKSVIVGNVAYNNGLHGIYMMDFSEKSTLNYNIAHDNPGTGIQINQSDENTVIGNEAYNNNDGMFFAYSKTNTITNNNCHNNANIGMTLNFICSDSILTRNDLNYNKYGLYIASSGNCKISYNNFVGNSNSKQAYEAGVSNSWNGSGVGNFWSDWTSPDANGDLIVDNPYLVDGTGGAKDLYPLALRAGQVKIIGPNDDTADEDAVYIHDYTLLQINMPPSNPVWGANTNASWLTMDPMTGRLSGTPRNINVGTCWVNVSVSGGPGNTDFTNFTMTVVNVDYPPVMNTTAVEICQEDHLYWVDYNATDMDSDFIHVWNISTNATFLGIEPSTGVLSGTPNNSQVGLFNVKVKVKDGVFTVTQEFNLTVINVNDPPVITTVDKTSVQENESILIYYEAVDIDPTHDSFTWRLKTNAMDFLGIHPKTGALSGTPHHEDIGSYYVNVSVDDNRGGVDFHNFTLAVNPKSDVNTPPGIYFPPDDFAMEEDTVDSRIRLKDWFVDVDFDVMTFRCVSPQSFTVEIKADGQVYLTPSSNWTGFEVLTFVANDTFSETSDSVNVTVVNVNDPPVNAMITLEKRPYYAGQAQPAWGNATDGDLIYGDVLTYQWTNNVTSATWGGPLINLSLPIGTYMITLRATDTDGKYSEVTQIVYILKAPDVEPNITDDDDDDIVEPQEPKPLWGNWWFWLIIIILVLLIVVIIVIIVIKSRKKNEPKKQETFAREGTFQPQDANEPSTPPPEVFGPAPGPPVITPTYAPALPPAQPAPAGPAQYGLAQQGEVMDFSATPEEAEQQQQIDPKAQTATPYDGQALKMEDLPEESKAHDDRAEQEFESIKPV